MSNESQIIVELEFIKRMKAHSKLNTWLMFYNWNLYQRRANRIYNKNLVVQIYVKECGPECIMNN